METLFGFMSILWKEPNDPPASESIRGSTTPGTLQTTVTVSINTLHKENFKEESPIPFKIKMEGSAGCF